ncbi:MAG: Unknown protein [uncultured Sulfurovum sp.]|uniref:Uncharacterized protein n=1 Tax=uncultured Sulfurovum sp. TaxID=269237 RepID=A0A6S6UIG9_9BACT|nr:MAG: Unknown protein [uncultured Sulfurovum sp.]
MKHLYLVVVILFSVVFLGACSNKSPLVEKVSENKVEVVEIAEVAEVEETQSIIPQTVSPKMVLRKNETLVEETKVMRNIGADIPTSCVMWSDGCNVCTRAGGGKASCTTGPKCSNKMFSCLQWP